MINQDALRPKLFQRINKTIQGVALATCVAYPSALARAASWTTKQADMWHTGRASFVIPDERLRAGLLSAVRWQHVTPGAPNGNVDAGSMSFFDGAGPNGADIVVGTYHWPKGVIGLDRHTGHEFWSGLPAGGEEIGVETPAFSQDGATIYITNDYTASEGEPAGRPLMAFSTVTGPSSYWHNGGDVHPEHFTLGSPVLAPDGRIFGFNWTDRPYGATDSGTELHETWAASLGLGSCFSGPSLYSDQGVLHVIGTGRDAKVACFDGTAGDTLWVRPAGGIVEAWPTIDPANGNVYVAAGDNSIFIVGLDANGNALWGSTFLLVHDGSMPGALPERAQATGCLSHDGQTYYFQTNGQSANGALYAINTSNGTIKWRYSTHSAGWEMDSACPIVTPNGIVLIGNNNGGVYYALQDLGAGVAIVDSFLVAPGGTARASATLADDGMLYLPLRTTWSASDGDGRSPDYSVHNLLAGIDMALGAQVTLPPPSHPMAVARNRSISLSWNPLQNPAGTFSAYAIFRDTLPFNSVEGRSPILLVSEITASTAEDVTAANGVSYYYIIGTLALDGTVSAPPSAVGPRTPYDETDLQVTAIARTPRFPRYVPEYTDTTVTEPSGFGPYWVKYANGRLGAGQTDSTARFPEIGQPVAYTATIRNRATNAWAGNLSGSWQVDGIPSLVQVQNLVLLPDDQASYSFVLPWDGTDHEIKFHISPMDARGENDVLTVYAKSVAFLTYVDRSLIEEFREQSANYPAAATNDFLDWQERHMTWLNSMIGAAGSPTHVHFDVLSVVEDTEADSSVDQTLFAVFPFRYHTGDIARCAGCYYDAADDIDYGLLHERGHQLGLIDMYQMNLEASQNDVTHALYRTAPCLMNGVSHTLSPQSAWGLTHWSDTARGYFGQYLYGIPRQLQLRLLGDDDLPVTGATVTTYQACERPGSGRLLSLQPKWQPGVTDSAGVYDIPNVPIDTTLIPPTLVGDRLYANPFGYVDMLGRNGTLLFKVEKGLNTDYVWLDLAEVNAAYSAGLRDVATLDRHVFPCNANSIPAAVHIYGTGFDNLAMGNLQPLPGSVSQDGWYSALAVGDAFGVIDSVAGRSGYSLRAFAPATNPPGLQTILQRDCSPVAVQGHSRVSLSFDFLAHSSNLAALNIYDAKVEATGGSDAPFEILGVGLTGGNGNSKSQTGVNVSINTYDPIGNNNAVITASVGQGLSWDEWHTVTISINQETDKYGCLTVDGVSEDLSMFKPPRASYGGVWQRGQLIEHLDVQVIPTLWQGTGAITADEITVDNLSLAMDSLTTTGVAIPNESDLLLHMTKLEILAAGPTPTYGRVRMRYAVPDVGPVEVSVLDVTGRVVKTIASGMQSPGIHVVTWDGKSDAGAEVCVGVYLLNVVAGDRRVSRKILVLR